MAKIRRVDIGRPVQTAGDPRKPWAKPTYAGTLVNAYQQGNYVYAVISYTTDRGRKQVVHVREEQVRFTDL